MTKAFRTSLGSVNVSVVHNLFHPAIRSHAADLLSVYCPNGLAQRSWQFVERIYQLLRYRDFSDVMLVSFLEGTEGYEPCFRLNG